MHQGEDVFAYRAPNNNSPSAETYNSCITRNKSVVNPLCRNAIAAVATLAADSMRPPGAAAVADATSSMSSSQSRFRVFFALSSSSGTLPPSHSGNENCPPPTTVADCNTPPLLLARITTMTHVVVPFRAPLSELTVQDLVDQSTSRIAKRYTSLTENYVVDHVLVIPLCRCPPLPSPPPLTTAKGNTGLVVTADGEEHAELGNGFSTWDSDTDNSFLLDVAMNGADELDLHFYYHSGPQRNVSPGKQSASERGTLPTGAPPPYEIVLCWRPKVRDVASTPTHLAASGKAPGRLSPIEKPVPPATRAGQNTPTRMMSPLVGQRRGASPQQRASPNAANRQALPPLAPVRSATPPTCRPALEPIRPQEEGGGRYQRVPVASSSSSGICPLPAAATSLPPHQKPLNIVSPSSVGRYPPDDDDVVNVASNHTTVSASVNAASAVARQPVPAASLSPITASATPTRVARVGSDPTPVPSRSGRRSLTTFVDSDGSLGQQAATVSGSGDGVIPFVNQMASRLPASTVSPMYEETDSEANPEEAFAFQEQLLELTEAEDRDTVVMQEQMEFSVIRRQWPLAVSASEITSPPRAHAPTTSATASATTNIPVAKAPHPPVAPRGAAESGVSRSSLEAASLFATAPTSRIATEMLKRKEIVQVDDDIDDDESSLYAVLCDELMNEWFSLRHQVLTEERKVFRVLQNDFKALQREATAQLTNAVRDEALREALRFGDLASSPVRWQTKPQQQESAPPLTRALVTPAAPAPPPPSEARVQQSQALRSADAAEALEIGRPTPPPSEVLPSPLRSLAAAAKTTDQRLTSEAGMRMVKIIEVTEQADRREISDEASKCLSQLREEWLIGLRRIILREEQRLILLERNVVEDEQRLRDELVVVEERKFAMFAGLCAKGVQRIRMAAAVTAGVGNWEEL